MKSKSTEQPLATVVIPTYNRRDSLRITLAGLARQTYPFDRFEVLVISDGATDGTEAMVEEFGRNSPYPLRLVCQANAGPARARNRGVREARGDIVVFLDDDVEPLSRFVEIHVAHHTSDQHVAVIGPMSPDPERFWMEPMWVAWEHTLLQRQYLNFQSGVWPEAGPNNFYTGNASVRRRHVLAAGGFNETFRRQEDVDLAFRMQQQSGVHFVFDAAAEGIHRPSRTLAAWLKTPYEYGRLDMIRIRRGDLSWEVIQDHYASRSGATRAVSALSLACPPLGALLRATLLAGARVSYAMRLRGPALAALSVVYTLRYVEGAQAALGSAQQLVRLLRSQSQPA